MHACRMPMSLERSMVESAKSEPLAIPLVILNIVRSLWACVMRHADKRLRSSTVESKRDG